jgi:uncharacterized protein
MATYKTPGVYAEEISVLPPSVAEVSTAVPAFIGYTREGKKVARITTMLEYETLFGLPPSAGFTVVTNSPTNGTGTNGHSKKDGEAQPGSDAESVSSSTEANIPVKETLKVKVIPPVELVQLTRTANAAQYLMYYSLKLYFNNGGGACYIVSIGKNDGTLAAEHFINGLAELEKEDEPTLIVLPDAVNLSRGDLLSVYQKALEQSARLGDRFVIMDVPPLKSDEAPALKLEAQRLAESVALFRQGIGTTSLKYGAAYMPYLQTTLPLYYDEKEIAVDDKTLVDQKSTNTTLYNQLKTLLSQERIILPPSAAVAGVYARIDRERGVWKAPANASLSSVIGPVSKITQEDQDNLNVDPTGGKSINAIRAFTGKGTLVWGARTLAGNDNEWRYVSVRRLFNMIEESTLKATSFAVFEPNDASTWLKVKAMIESYLYGLWEQGALAGPTPAAAYFVSVGLGKTMTTQDILEGRMIVKIGVAAVRPSEFIILQFSHKLQEA